jgi:hypothetical protein
MKTIISCGAVLPAWSDPATAKVMLNRRATDKAPSMS